MVVNIVMKCIKSSNNPDIVDKLCLTIRIT